MRSESFHSFLLFGDSALELCDCGFLFLHSAVLFLYFPLLLKKRLMFFEKLVEQHRVYRVVAHGVDLAVLVANHQVRVYLGYFLGDQAKLRCIFCVALVVKRHGLERENRFAGAVHWFNVALEAPRGAHRADLASGVDQDWYGVVVSGCHPTTATNKGAVLSAACADTDGVVLRSDTIAAEIDIVTAGGE